MNYALWGLQGLLALVFLAAGGNKLAQSREKLLANPMMGWANDFSSSQIKLIGLAEVLGAIGLVAPYATGILPILTPVAALALAVLMLGAAATHARRKEPWIPPVVLAVLSLGLAAGRFLA
ncbi:MAG: DoxX family protein [Sandaracinus sp.]